MTIEQVDQRARELRRIGRDLGHLLILGGGDIVEGCTIYPNQAYEIDGDRRAQVRAAVTFVLDGLDRLAPLFSGVTVLVVGGNEIDRLAVGRPRHAAGRSRMIGEPARLAAFGVQQVDLIRGVGIAARRERDRFSVGRPARR